ncbi:MAG: hypothetical protein L3J39_05270 [Verrucomicrobiales bacterium]|nr:hypothetical protein [Verrucomicrobiales bacterium]
MLFYSLLLITAGLLILKNHRRYHLFTPDYWSFIFTPLKVAIYLAGTLALVLPVPYLKLHSWDYPIALFQPAITYLTAPWAVAVFYRSIKRRSPWDETFVASILCLFCGSWSVELYLLYRDGYYMPDWLFNIPVGIVCYITAGLVWNIEWNNGHRRYTFTKEP